MVKTKIEAGVCGFITDVEAFSEDSQNVSFKINTTCEKIGKMSQDLKSVDAFNEIKEGFNGELYKVFQKHLKGCCAGCAVPVGIFKSMQVAAMLALPQDVVITITKQE
jgi:hypothetical protein